MHFLKYLYQWLYLLQISKIKVYFRWFHFKTYFYFKLNSKIFVNSIVSELSLPKSMIKIKLHQSIFLLNEYILLPIISYYLKPQFLPITKNQFIKLSIFLNHPFIFSFFKIFFSLKSFHFNKIFLNSQAFHHPPLIILPYFAFLRSNAIQLLLINY